MATVVVVQDVQGNSIDELPGVLVPSRTWMLDEIGDATVSIPRSHWKATARYMYAYNRLLIRSDLGVGDWAGVLSGRKWNSTDIALRLEDLRFLFGRRRVSYVCPFAPDQTAGQVIEAIVGDVEANYHIGVKVSPPFDYDGLTYSAQCDWQWRDALECLAEITAWEGSYWWVDSRGGVHHLHRRGKEKLGVVIREGRHIVGEPTFSEDYSDIVNDTIAFSSQDEDRLITYPYTDAESVQAWGRFGDTITLDEEVVESVELEPIAKGHVEEKKNPYRTLDLTICNEDSMFSRFTDGDIITVEIPSYGFSGLRAEGIVLGRTLTEPKPELRVILQVLALRSL